MLKLKTEKSKRSLPNYSISSEDYILQRSSSVSSSAGILRSSCAFCPTATEQQQPRRSACCCANTGKPRPKWIVTESSNRIPTDAHIALSSAAAAGTAERPGDTGLLWALRSAFPEEKPDADFFRALSFSSNFKSLNGEGGVFVGMRRVSFDNEEDNDNDDPKEGAEEELLGGVIVIEYDCAKRKAQAKQWWRFSKNRQLAFNLKLFYHMQKRYGVVDLLEKDGYKSHRTNFFRLLSLSNTLSDSAHALYAPMPHWFLKDMSVHPNVQGRGIGKEILRKLHGVADLHGMTIYLETSGEKNTRFY